MVRDGLSRLLVIGGLLAICPDTVSGQVIEGQVLDAASNRPLAEVPMELLDSATRVVARAFASSERAAFSFAAPAPAEYGAGAAIVVWSR